jgi:predicted oxidoreductase
MASGTTPMVWSPLGGGRLATGEGVSPELVAVLDRLAGDRAVDRATVALAFALAHPSRPIAIVGTQRPERLTASLAALEVSLDRDEVYAVIQASLGHPLP